MERSGYTEEELMLLDMKPPLVEEFTIEGLYGYRTIGLSSSHSATILIARNGAGKTTLLAALDAFLKCQFLRLADIQFSRIVCKIRGSERFILRHEDVASLLTVDEDSAFFSRAKQIGVHPRILREFVDVEYPSVKDNSRQLHDHEVFSKILSSVGYVSSQAKRVCEDLHDLSSAGNEALSSLQKMIKAAIGDVEIVYLPTYRRIELPLSAESQEERDRPGARRRPSVQSRLGFARKGLFNADIQFGLSDIAERLSELNQEILYNSNQGYREISANIINELLDGTFEDYTALESERPDKESLNLFFSRIKEGRRIIPYRDVTIPNMDQVYGEGGRTAQSKQFLNYFLAKLNTVIKATRGIESQVEEFITNSNKYLSSTDESTNVDGDMDLLGSLKSTDDKLLVLDKKTLRVLVHSIAANRRIPMDSLSSGEKQMISLFARLYLYSGDKLFLIDEPELSLSIDWQRKILLDIAMAPTCKQVIAITHSPFVFDNALEKFARSISLKLEEGSKKEMQVEIEDEIDE